jgi:hypothetical protein
MMKSARIVWSFIGLALVLLAGLVTGDTSSPQPNLLSGALFTIAVPPSAYANDSDITLFIVDASGSGMVTGNISTFSNPNETFYGSGPLVTIVLPGSTFIPSANGTSNSSITVNCDRLCSVQVVVNSSTVAIANEGTAVLPSPFGASSADYIVNSVYSNGAISVTTVGSQLGSFTMTFPNGSTSEPITLQPYESYSLSGTGLNGTRIHSDDTFLAVFVGRTGANASSSLSSSSSSSSASQNTTGSSYLLEQLSTIATFDTDYIFVNPSASASASASESASASASSSSSASGSGSNAANAVLHFANAGDQPINVEVSSNTSTCQTSFLIASNQTYALCTNKTSLSIHSNGSVGVQVVAGSLANFNRSQFTLVGNNQFFGGSLASPSNGENLAAYFNVPSNTSNLLLFVALTKDIGSTNNSLLLNSTSVPLTSFKPAANASFSYAFYTPLTSGVANLTSSFQMAAYSFDSGAGMNSGTFLGSYPGPSFG